MTGTPGAAVRLTDKCAAAGRSVPVRQARELKAGHFHKERTMKTRLLILAGLVAVAMLAVAVAPSIGTAANPKGAPKADAAKAAPGEYDPTKAGGYRAEMTKKIEAAVPTEAFVKPAKPRKLLVYTESTGFYHDSIPVAAMAFKLMGEKTGAFEATWNNDPNFFTAENLAKYDGVFMDNTVTDAPKDAAGRQAFIDFVKNGGGLMGTHAGADCNHSWPEYQNMIGGEFAGHPWGKISIKNEDPTSPLLTMFGGKGFNIDEEIYTFKQVTPQRPEGYSRDKLHILLSIDMEKSGLKDTTRKDMDYAMAWTHEYGKGHVFYCAIGHRQDHFWNPVLLKFYLAGIQYALGDLKADATPSAKLQGNKVVPGPDLKEPFINIFAK
jgi:type 1 glutamine amidotransferase